MTCRDPSMAEQGAFPRFLVLDGGLAVELVAGGYQIDDDPLWGCRLIDTAPTAIKAVHTRFLEAGADVIETATYQASLETFQKHFSVTREEATQLLRKGVELAKEARDEFWEKEKLKSNGRMRPLVAGSVGPYGACQHDGSEYTGTYVDTVSKQDLVAWHRPRVQVLVDAGVDLLGIDTIPAQAEAEALVALLEEFPQTKAWMSFSCKDGAHVCHGEPLLDAASATLKSQQVIGVGINCTSPDYIDPLLRSLQPIRDKKIFVVYPNSGENWTADKKWHREGETILKSLADFVPGWLAEGATWIGGCCRTKPQDLTAIRTIMMKYIQASRQ